MRSVLIGLAVIILAACSSCSRKTFTTKVDTIYVQIKETSVVEPTSKTAEDSSSLVIDTVFLVIEKECPEIAAKLPTLKRKIKEATTMQAKTGGSISTYSAKFNATCKIKYAGNIAWAEWSGKLPVVVKTEKVYMSTFEQIMSTWFAWVPPWAIIVIILFFKLK